MDAAGRFQGLYMMYIDGLGGHLCINVTCRQSNVGAWVHHTYEDKEGKDA
jgi:hypothetical protein